MLLLFYVHCVLNNSKPLALWIGYGIKCAEDAEKAEKEKKEEEQNEKDEAEKGKEEEEETVEKEAIKPGKKGKFLHTQIDINFV